MVMRRAFFFDRDGVINIDRHYLFQIADFQYIPGVIDFMKTVNESGYTIFVVTNQSGIGRGFYTEADFQQLNQWMINDLKSHGVYVERTYHCPHAPESDCFCRKPNPGMLVQAQLDYDISLSKSWLIGDKYSDLEAAQAAGINHTIWFTSPKQQGHQKPLKSCYLISDDFINIKSEFKHISQEMR